jgi:hypothetical protein
MNEMHEEDLRLLAHQALKSHDTYSPESIRAVVKAKASLLGCSESAVERVARALEEVFQTTMELGHALQDVEHVPWLRERMMGKPSPFWDRYREYLERDKSFSPAVVLRMGEVLDRILDLSGDPCQQALDRRGLVVGQVQSGKTANYTGLVCKAVDAGFKVIFIIAGVHNNLRAQTQRRIDEGFIGRDSAKGRNSPPIGVGKQRAVDSRPISFTSAKSDFAGAVADQIGFDLSSATDPAIFVIKKNGRVLENLNGWLKNHSSRREGGVPLPALVIDDEADNASIDVGKEGAISKINSELRKLLALFPRSSYVGYTATPFANIFIDPRSNDEMRRDDLFPRSFILALDPPSNYHGPERVFGAEESSTRLLRIADDYQDLLPLSHKKSLNVTALPGSLERAIDEWFVATTVRQLRETTPFHSSMMINASRFVDVQKQLADRVREVVDARLRAVRANSRMPRAADRDSNIQRLKLAFDEGFADSGASWEQVLGALATALPVVEVKVINGTSPDNLDYSVKSARYVAIGGLSLSRGITLEGLTVSYFLRSSKMYDTLMQMGRWFGYRPRYEDLVRVWLTKDSQGWYEHITEVIQELRQDLIAMERYRATPMEFGLKVRTHPDALLITARNKMGSSRPYVHSTSLSNRCVQLHEVSASQDHRLANDRLALDWLRQIRAENGQRLSGTPHGAGWLVRRVPLDKVIAFLSEYRVPPTFLPSKHPENLKRFLELSQDSKLCAWDVFIPYGEGRPLDGLPFSGQRCLQRTAGEDLGDTLSLGDKYRVSGRGIEAAGLDPEAIKSVLDSYPQGNPPDVKFRDLRTCPLFMLFFVERTSGAATSAPLVSFGISIPRGFAEGEEVAYQVNQTFLERNRSAYGEVDDDVEERD